jgi:outer membrane lipoprotein SlyB
VTSKTVWVTRVEMKDGSMRTFETEAAPGWKTGSVVKVHGKGLAAI